MALSGASAGLIVYLVPAPSPPPGGGRYGPVYLLEGADMAGALDADLVLEGGGVKGIALAGAISVLQDRGYRFHRVAGTSAGAIVGALVAAGTPHTRLREMMRDLDYRGSRILRCSAGSGRRGQ